MLLVGGYFSLKLYIYNKINKLLTEKIAFADLKLGILPPRLRLNNLKNVVIKDENLLSFKNISLEIPIQNPFADKLRANLFIHQPHVVLTDKILEKKKKGSSTNLPFELGRINIIDGELVFNGRKIHMDLLDFDLNSFTRSGRNMYKVTSPHLKVVFPLSGHEVKLEGQMNCEFRIQRTCYKISSFEWNTEKMRISLNGRVFKSGTIALGAALKGTPDKILYPILKSLRPQGYLELNARVQRRKKEPLFVDGDVGCNHFTIENEPFRNLTGTLKWNSRDKEIKGDLFFIGEGLRTHLTASSQNKKTRIHARNCGARLLTRVIKIDSYLPLGSVIRDVDVTIYKGIIKGGGLLDPSPETKPDTFNMSGEVTFNYNSHTKAVAFAGKNLKTEFGPVPFLDGESTPNEFTSFKLKGRALVRNMGKIDKYSDYYINLDFARWKLKGGNGYITLDVKRRGEKYDVESDIDIRNFTTSSQPVRMLKGHLSTRQSITDGRFRIEDPKIKGNAAVLVNNAGYHIDITDMEGEFGKILKILELDAKISGWGSGDVRVNQKSGDKTPLITGHFKADKINFYDYFFETVEGDLEYLNALSLENLTYIYNGGKGRTRFFIDYGNETYKLEGQIKGIDIERLNPEFHGKGDIAFKGEGAFDKDPIRFDYNSGDIRFYQDRTFTVNGDGKVFTNFSNFHIDAGGNIINAGSASPLTLSLKQVDGIYSGAFSLKLNNINLLIPWGNNIGSVVLDGRISGTGNGELSTEGRAVFSGRILAFPNFPHVLENFKGDVIFKDLNFTLRSLQGTIGGGSVTSNGYLNIEDNRLKDLSINFVGRDMVIYPMDRTSFTLNTNLYLKYMDTKLLLSGDMNVLSGLWRREVEEDINFNTDPSLSASGSKLLDRLEYDLKMVGKENLVLDNSLGKASGKFSLQLTGTRAFPILMGYIECREGKINFSEKQFDLIKAKLVFNNKFLIDPVVDVESESFIKNYRIKFNIKGRTSLLKPELQSSPPLPYRDILTLITLGELFERPTSTELSSRVDSGTTGLIASQLTAQIKKRTKKIFGNYMLKIDPNISNIAGASFEDSSRLIVGKEVAKNLLVVYATNFSSNRQQVLYLKFQLSPSVSLIGKLNEEKRLSLDLRFRKRN